jgi:hypothetical protein
MRAQKGQDAEEVHRDLVRRLEDRVKGQYSITMREVPVRNPCTGQLVGEIDLVGIVDGVWDIYEVKVNDGLRKARRQLENLRHYLDGCADLRLYYYSGKGGEIVRVG